VRRAVAEAVGTGMLVAVVVGSGIAAQRLSPGQPGAQLLENSLATGAGLVAIILAFAPVSGAHLNPVVTLAAWASGDLGRRELGPYVGAQLAGGLAGVVVANLMFDLGPVSISTNHRAAAATDLGEVVATFGLLVVITGLTRARRLDAAPYAVGAYITAAYWFTSSTSFANPAVTVARSLTDSFTGIAPASVPAFVLTQLLGAGFAVALAGYLHPRTLGARPPSKERR
jgi:glycerol uptake facilitator-like aquaporin